MNRFQLVKRDKPIKGGQLFSFGVGLVVALALGAILLVVADHSPVDIYLKMADSAFGSRRAWSATLTQAAPLGLAGLAVAVAGSMGLWNIGAEGQIVAGAIAGSWIARLAPDLAGPALIPLMIVAGVVGGALLALGPALARAHLGVNEIITTLMLNEVAIRMVRYLVNGPWKDPKGGGFAVAPELPEQSTLPTLFERANIGILIAAAVLLAFGFFASRSKWGFELRIAGSSEKAAEYVGISLERKIVTVLVLSGALAGLAGGLQLGATDRIVEGISEGWGFAGIIVAALALMRPSGVAAVAVAFGALRVGGVAIKGQGVPDSITEIIQALVLLCALAAAVFATYRIQRPHASSSLSDTGSPELETADEVVA